MDTERSLAAWEDRYDVPSGYVLNPPQRFLESDEPWNLNQTDMPFNDKLYRLAWALRRSGHAEEWRIRSLPTVLGASAPRPRGGVAETMNHSVDVLSTTATAVVPPLALAVGG